MLNFLHKLALNHREQIINDVLERCENDVVLCQSSESEEMKHNMVHFLSNTILDSLAKDDNASLKDDINIDFEVAAENINGAIISSYLIGCIGVKLLICILNHFRNSINQIILHNYEDKNAISKYIDTNAKYFDLFESSILNHWEVSETENALLKKMIEITGSNKIEELRRQAIENRKLLDEVIEHDKLKTEFYSNLSHEFRTPLNVILGTLQLVDMQSFKGQDPAYEKSRKYYKIMRQNCYRLLRLVNNLIDLNKLDAGYMQLNMGNHEIVSIITNIATSVSDYIENKGISFIYYTKTASKVVACDPDKIERIVLNLLSNAIKFTDAGGKIIVNVWDENNSIFVSVKDTGIGIPKEKHDLVFGRFVQIEKSLSRNVHGSGIGLSLVKSLVEMHGGKISLVSEAGKGSEFIVKLPINESIVSEPACKESKYTSNNKIETINIEFSDIYS